MPKISVIIPTHNRPELLRAAINSVLNQTYQDFEIIVVDDGLERRADKVVESFNDERIKYIQHSEEKGGSAARNTGIRASQGEFIAFLDDDDQWLPEKLEIQMAKFENTPSDVGFCFSAVRNIYDDFQHTTKVPEGINDYFDLALKWTKGFLTVTLLVKKEVLKKTGLFDESLPSHQESDLIIRIAKKYKGLGINRPLVNVNMKKGYERIGGNLKRRIAGRETLLRKYSEEYKKRPSVLAKHLFELGLMYRDGGNFKEAKNLFKRAVKTNFRFLYFLHYISLLFNGKIYKIFRS